jgi:hypothetical protein
VWSYQRRSQSTQTSLALPRATIRRGKWIIPSMQWNGPNTIRSTGLSWVTLKASWIRSAFSTPPPPRESTRPETSTNTKVVDREKKPKEPKGDFPEAHKEVNYIYGGPDSYESRRKQKLTAREVMAVSPTTLSTLSDPRSPSPSTAVTTRLCAKARAVSSYSLPHRQARQAQPSPHRWR